MVKKFKSFKEGSRSNWGVELSEGEKLSTDQIQLGCILRIADSMESIASYIKTINDDNQMLQKKVKSLKVLVYKYRKEVRGVK